MNNIEKHNMPVNQKASVYKWLFHLDDFESLPPNIHEKNGIRNVPTDVCYYSVS